MSDEPVSGWDPSIAVLADVDFSRFKVRYGGIDQWALTAFYNFRREDVDLAKFDPEQPSEAIKTNLHETVHVYQLLATSYGHYTQLLRDFQSNQVLRIIQSLLARGVGLRAPVVHQALTELKKKRSDELGLDLYLWYLAEMVMIFLEHDVELYAQQMLSGLPVKYPSLAEQFALLNHYLHQYCRNTGRSTLSPPGPNIRFSRSRGELDQIQLPSVGLKVFGEFDVEDVMESAAKCAEYWERRGDTWRHLIKPSLDAGRRLWKYNRMLEDAYETLKISDLNDFTLTYGVLADLALNPPVLPQHTAWESMREDVSSLSPFDRLWTLIRRASTLEPVHILERDYTRFVEEVCGACNWPTPQDIGNSVSAVGPGPQADLSTLLYHRSIALRNQVPHIFSDLDVWFISGRGTGSFHGGLPGAELRYYFLRRWLRQALIGRDLVVAMPYAASMEDMAHWTDVLSESLVRFGVPRAQVQLCAPGIGRLHLPEQNL